MILIDYNKHLLTSEHKTKIMAAKTEDLDWNLTDKLLQIIWIINEQHERTPKQIKKIENSRNFELLEELLRTRSFGEFNKLTSEKWRLIVSAELFWIIGEISVESLDGRGEAKVETEVDKDSISEPLITHSLFNLDSESFLISGTAIIE